MKGSKESFEVTDAAIGDWIFCEGKCLSTCDSDKFRTMLQVVEKAGSSYVPPNRNRLSTEHLDKAYDIQVQAEQSQSSGDLSTYGATICSDGWNSITDRSLINVMLSMVSGSWMKMSLDASKKTKGNNFIADLIVKEIMSLPDPRSVIVVAVDGGNRTSLPLIEEKCPWVSGSICTSHWCDLILQDVGDPDHSKVWSPKFDWIQEEVRKWDKMVSYVRNHTKLLDMFRGFSDLELLKHCETRFATKFLSGARLCRVKSRMQQMVTSDKFQTWVDSLKKQEERETGKVFKEQVLDDVGYWYRSLFIIEMYGPVFGLLKACDMDEATLGVVYERMAHAVSTIDELPTDAWFTEQRKEDALDHLEWRWSYLHCPAHSAAFCVNPFFHDETVSNDAELMSNLESCALKMMASEEECLTLMEQYDHWKDAQITGLAKIALEKKRVSPHKWWKQYGSKWPVLQSFACRILAQRSSATACERNWSGYDYIWSKKRNRLDSVRAGKLVYVFMNSKLSCHSLTKSTEMRMMMDLNYEETRKPCSTQSSEDTQYAYDVAEARVHFEESDPQLIYDIENDDVDIMFKAPSFRRSKRLRGLEHYVSESAHP